jgi:hypothetical protein
VSWGRSLLGTLRRVVSTDPPRPVRDTDDRAALEAGLAAAAGEVAVGRWADAAEQLQGLTRTHADAALAHRELARSALELATWGASAVGAGPSGGPERLVSLDELAAARPESQVLHDPIGVGRAAMERAVELRPRSEAWLAPLAELREAAGDLDGAINAYERAVEASETSRSSWVVRSRHLWQFQLERARHQAGSGRVEDPLFAASVDPDPGSSPGDLTVGIFRARFTHQGLNVGGWVVDPDVETLELALAGTVLRRVNVGQGALRGSDTLLQRGVLDVGPPLARLTVTTLDGRRLATAGRAGAVTVSLPSASGELDDLLATGVTVDKKGALTPTEGCAAARQDDHLRLYRAVRTFFADVLGRDLFVLYGTLLGVHREGELIRGDDDFDCGYVSDAGHPLAVKAEAVGVIEQLVRSGFDVSFNRRGRLFRVHRRDIGDAALHLDVHPIWFEGPQLYLHNRHRFPATVDDLLPTQEQVLRGGTVLVPHRPEVVLERLYGPRWRTPDPGYVDDATGTDPEVMARLAEALLTPDEYRELATRLAEPARAHREQGRLVSIAAQSLYPLDAFIP